MSVTFILKHFCKVLRHCTLCKGLFLVFRPSGSSISGIKATRCPKAIHNKPGIGKKAPCRHCIKRPAAIALSEMAAGRKYDAAVAHALTLHRRRRGGTAYLSFLPNTEKCT